MWVGRGRCHQARLYSICTCCRPQWHATHGAWCAARMCVSPATAQAPRCPSHRFFPACLPANPRSRARKALRCPPTSGQRCARQPLRLLSTSWQLPVAQPAAPPPCPHLHRQQPRSRRSRRQRPAEQAQRWQAARAARCQRCPLSWAATGELTSAILRGRRLWEFESTMKR